VLRDRLVRANGFALVELMVVVAVVGIIVGVAVPYYISYKRTACDRAAQRDISGLAAAIERFRVELTDTNCRFDELSENLQLGWLVGPYYGWTGTSTKCQVMVRRGTGEFKDEVWGCAEYGSHPTSDPKSRYVHRVSLIGGSDLQTARGVCAGADWNAYGGIRDTCYTTSMLVDSGCVPKEPLGKTNCQALNGSM
jgi:prepilin-type N-terminal cleavage/methylation domain-containing protein